MPAFEDEGERLQKVLSRVGLFSRRVAEDMIEAGRVTVNGEPARLGQRVDIGSAQIEVDGALIGVKPGLVHYLLNKPTGVVTTAADTHGRPIVTDLVPDEPRVYPVGRLDRDTSGLLILTNDAALGETLTNPESKVPKTYAAKVRGRPSEVVLEGLRRGVVLDDGPTLPARVALVREGPKSAWLEIEIVEGRNRQVRRMCEAIGHPVLQLVRTKIGGLELGPLASGEVRELDAAEIRRLEARPRAAK